MRFSRNHNKLRCKWQCVYSQEENDMQNEWRSFKGGAWEREINVRDFIQKNYTPYNGDSSFLEGPTQDTTDLWDQVLELSKQEREAGGVWIWTRRLFPLSHPMDRGT